MMPITPFTLLLWTAAATGPAVLPPVAFPGADPALTEAAWHALVDAAGPDASTPGGREPSPPPPPPSPETLTALRATLDTAFDEADFTAAAAAGRSLVEGLQARVSVGGSIDELVEGNLRLADVYLAAGERLLAAAQLEAAARLRPGLELDLRRWSPAVVEAFTAARARVLAEPAAELQLAVRPPGSVIYVDDVRRGAAPTTLSLRPGRHVVWVGAPLHTPVRKELTLAAGARTVLDDALAPEPLQQQLTSLRGVLLGDGDRAAAMRALDGIGDAVGGAPILVLGIVAANPSVARGPLLLLARIQGDVVVAGAAALPPGAPGASVTALLVAIEAGAPPAPPPGVGFDADARLLGLAPGASDTEDSILASPVLWGAVGVGVLVAAGAGVAAVLLNQPVVEAGPQETRVLVVAVP